jgi:DNA-binding CsgD family transcriptional regulator
VAEARGRAEADELRRRAAALRRRGLALDAIALRLGISGRRAAGLLREAGIDPRAREVRCAACRRVVARGAAGLRGNAPTVCVLCLARTPGASFGQRLRAYRLAAGLTQRQLAERAGLDAGTVWSYEQDETVPRGGAWPAWWPSWAPGWRGRSADPEPSSCRPSATPRRHPS